MAITLQTIETLPLVEEVNENTSLVGWDGEKTVRVDANELGGSGNATGFLLEAKYNEEIGDLIYGEADVVNALVALQKNLNVYLLPYENAYKSLVLNWALSSRNPDGYRYLNVYICNSSGENEKIQIAVDPSIIPDGM